MRDCGGTNILFIMRRQLLTLILIFAVSFVSFVMRAATATELVTTISEFKGDGSGSLIAIVEGNTVTITGALSDVTSSLSLNIDPNVVITWQAEISTGSTFSDRSLISLTGYGTFNVATGGFVYATNDNVTAIYSNSTLITVSGTGRVESTGDNYSCAISTAGNVEVKDEAQVNTTTTYGQAITTSGTNSLVMVSGGTVSSTSHEAVIYAYGENNIVTICGTGKVEGNSMVILASGNVEVKDEAQVSTTSGIAVRTSSMITISGTSKVEATGYAGVAIATTNNVEVKDEAQVSAPLGDAISANGSSTITVSGGTVSTSSGTAICMWDGNSILIVSGGTVSTTTGTAIYVFNGGNSKVIISGTGKVKATDDNGIAISTNGNIELKIEVKDEAQVSATTGRAINYGESTTLDVSGGVVFAYGNDISHDVISNTNPNNFTITGSGVVIAWDQASSKTYTQGSSNDITWLPETATAVWDKNGTSYGISYTNDTNTSFIPLEVTVVSNACDLTSVESPAGAIIDNQMITSTVDNNVTSQSISVVISPNATWKLFSNATCTNEITNKTMTLSEGENTAYIQVTAEDGTTVKIYTIVVTRENEIYTPHLYILPSSLNFAVSGKQQSFSIASNTDWTIICSESWLTVSPDSGSDDGTITVTADSNIDITERTAIITISGTGVEEQTINVTQDAAPIIPTLSVSTTSLSFTTSGEQQSFSIASNTDWTIISSYSWLTISPVSGDSDATITVTATANSDTIERTATIIVSGTGVEEQNINVTQDAEDIPIVVVPDETQPVGADGKGTIDLSLSIPSDATLTGSFDIHFPEGMTLDEELTVLSLKLSGNFFLSFSYKGDNTWLIEIKSNALRNSTASEYRKIMSIAYKVDESVQKGTYEASILNLDFLLDDSTPIKEDLLTVPISVERELTTIKNIDNTLFYAYSVNNTLKIESSHSELITIYSVTGATLYSGMKNTGLIEIPFASMRGSAFIIKGSISGTIKIMK